MTPSCPIDTHGSLVRAYPPPAQLSKPGSADRLQVAPPSWLTATTVPDGLSSQLATNCRGSPGSTASDGSVGADGDGPMQPAAGETAPLITRGGGKLGSFGGPLSQPVSTSRTPSGAARRARIGVHVKSRA